MEEIEVARSLLPTLKLLYKAGVIDIHPGNEPYIQLTEDKFKDLFPYMRAGEDGHYRFNWNGLMILAVCRD